MLLQQHPAAILFADHCGDKLKHIVLILFRHFADIVGSMWFQLDAQLLRQYCVLLLMGLLLPYVVAIVFADHWGNLSAANRCNSNIIHNQLW